jgi:pilus assembly protein CpaC
VSLAYTPTVLSDGRISLRVRPEVSQLDYTNAVTLNGTRVPGITTRRAETTVELGSGQSFMIGGLLQNIHSSTINKAPFLGDLPILGALFRSNGFQRNETELVIIITPYLVKPMDANAVALPTDGYRAPNDAESILLGQMSGSTPGTRPKPSMATPSGDPSIGALAPAPAAPSAPAPSTEQRQIDKALPRQSKSKSKKSNAPSAAPGFGF